MSVRALRHLMPFVAALAVAVAMPAAASAASYGTRTLTVGVHGKDVKNLQRYLAYAGHRVAPDGEFGPRTQRALRATETELELRADGIATTREQRAIKRAVKDPSAGGAAYVAPPPPESAPETVKDVITAGNAIATTPYKWGGGHAQWDDTGYDCSGSVSYALHGGGLLDSALVSGDFARWGSGGPGRWITIYANGGHVYMVVAGMRFDTSARSRTGSRWTMEQRDSDGFSVTHPRGL